MFFVHLLVLVFTMEARSAGAAPVANRDAFDGLQLQLQSARRASTATFESFAATRAARTPRGVSSTSGDPYGGTETRTSASSWRAFGALHSTSAMPLVGPADRVALLVASSCLHEPRAACADRHRARGPPPAL